MNKYRIYFWVRLNELRSIVVCSKDEPTMEDKYRLYINDTEFIDFEPYPINLIEKEK
jgi:hypothetical protein